MTTLTVKPKTHRRFTDEDLKPLLESFLGFDVELVRQDPRAGTFGVTWWEVIEVHLGHLAELGTAAAAGALIKDAATDLVKDGIKGAARRVGEAFVRWAKARGRQPGRNPKQPRHVTIFGPDGKPVLRVTVKDPDEDPAIEADE